MPLTHLDSEGRIRMVDVGDKPVTRRTAIASGFVRMARATIEAIKSHQTPKGDPLEAARLAGILAAKRTSELIPLCHLLPLDHADIQFEITASGISIEASATTESKTGVEMEALVGATVAALTIYDMAKSYDPAMRVINLHLIQKTGGKHDYFND